MSEEMENRMGQTEQQQAEQQQAEQKQTEQQQAEQLKIEQQQTEQQQTEQQQTEQQQIVQQPQIIQQQAVQIDNYPEDIYQRKSKSKRLEWKYILFGVVILTLLVAGTVFGYSRMPGQRVANSISLGNQYLNEVNYEQAVVEFNKALEIEPKNEEALKGILEVAARTNDEKLFKSTFRSLLKACESNETLAEESATLTQMALAAEPYYTETSYISLLQEMVSDIEEPELMERYLVVSNEAANEAWKQRDFETALDNLKHAYWMNPDNEQIQEELIRIVKQYAEYCSQNQQYDKGMEYIQWLCDLLEKPDLFKDQEESLSAMQGTDDEIQRLVNQLNYCFDNDNIMGIMEIMRSEEWKELTDKVYRVFYSKNLLEQDGINGTGTGIYKSYGKLYVYYGNYENGIRQGNGLWYCYNETYNMLDKYNLNWVDGVPQGKGTADIYSTTTIYGLGGVKIGEEQAHNQLSFEVVEGIFNGEYKVNDEDAGVQIKIDYVGGIGIIVDTPSDIEPYLAENKKIIGWSHRSDGGHLWYSYSTTRNGVPGIDTAWDYKATQMILE